MSTLQHISQQTLRIRFGRRMLVAAVAAAIAVAAVTIALVFSSGGAASVQSSDGAGALPLRSESKYLATHRLPAPGDVVEQPSLRTEPKYVATHPSR